MYGRADLAENLRYGPGLGQILLEFVIQFCYT